MRDRKGYNGLQGSGVPDLGSLGGRDIRAAIAQQLEQMTLAIYSRAAADLLASDAGPEVFRRMADQSRVAARAYFEARGVQFSDEATADGQ